MKCSVNIHLFNLYDLLGICIVSVAVCSQNWKYLVSWTNKQTKSCATFFLFNIFKVRPARQSTKVVLPRAKFKNENKIIIAAQNLNFSLESTSHDDRKQVRTCMNECYIMNGRDYLIMSFLKKRGGGGKLWSPRLCVAALTWGPTFFYSKWGRNYERHIK